MSAALAASICKEDVIISGAECVAKSYPRFWDEDIFL
jgi:5-enolpyruvylshikimate-3-phosphate synthase